MGFGLRRTLRSMKSMGRLSKTSDPPPRLVLESPVPHILTSNQPPTEDEVWSIREAIAHAESHLLDLELAEDSSQELASRQRDAYLEYVETHKRALSASRRLPVELVREILFYVLPKDPRTSLPTRYWRASSQVCKSWHAAALTVPELWSYVPRLQLSERHTQDPRFVSSLQKFLALSGHTPLRLRIDAPFREYKNDAHPALDELMKHAERWEYLQMDSAFSTYKYCFTTLGIQGRFTSLKCLELDIWRYNPSESHFVAFRDAPKLEEVSIRGMYPANMELPWVQLKVYKEKVQNHTGLRTVLNNAKALERLEVTRHTECILSGAVEMPHLKTLYMRYDNVIPPDNVAALLVLPVLEDLQIVEAPGEDLPSLTHNLFGSLERLRTQNGHLATPPTDQQIQLRLRRLAFRTQSITPGDLVTLLRLAPSVEELDMPHPPSHDLQALIYSPGITSAVPLVPNLRRLYIHTGGDWGDEDTYWNIARSRCERRQGSYDKDDELYSPERRIATLEAFHIIFEREDLCGTQQAALEGWFDPGSNSDPIFQALFLAKSILLHRLPELVGNAPRAKRGTFTGTAAFSKELHTVISTLEKMPRVTNVHHLYQSGAHLVLRLLMQLPDGHLPEDEKHHFRQRSRNLIDTWRPLFETDARDNLRWVRTGKTSLAYVPSHHELRSRSDAVDKLVFGLENDRHDLDIFWHRYM